MLLRQVVAANFTAANPGHSLTVQVLAGADLGVCMSQSLHVRLSLRYLMVRMMLLKRRH